MVNYTPETVSTDYDECDRLYFEELSLERVLDIYEQETCTSAIVSVGGQIPNTLALAMSTAGVAVSGTSPQMIDTAEDRNKFSALCDSVGIAQPAWKLLTTQEDALSFCEDVGYPCLVRPSYVLSGAAMNVAYSAEERKSYLGDAAEEEGQLRPVVLPHVDDEDLRHFGQELELRLLLEQPAHRLVGLPAEHLGDALGREVLLLEVLAQLADEAGGELGRELARQLEEQRARLDRVAPQQLLRQLGAVVLLLE